MSKVQNNEVFVTTKEAFQAVGLKWEGTFAEAGAGQIRLVHADMQKRLGEIPYVLNKETLLGLSYHATPNGDGFTHYAVVEVEKTASIPSGMMNIEIPTLTYATTQHYREQSIEQSYSNVY